MSLAPRAAGFWLLVLLCVAAYVLEIPVLNLQPLLDVDGLSSASASVGSSQTPQVEDSRAWHEEEEPAECKSTELIEHIRNDPCYFNENRVRARECACKTPDLNLGNRVTYVIPANASLGKALNKSTIEEKLLVVFIHVNKAGGSTIKKDILFPSMVQHEWDGAAFGTFKGWEGLGSPWPYEINPPTMPKRKRGKGLVTPINYGGEDEDDEGKEGYKEPLYSKCGNIMYHPSVPYEAIHIDHGCEFRLVWGSMSMGLCQHFPGRPCIYLINLRNPIQRAISNYNYVCIVGAEGRKKWKKEWKSKGECPLNIVEFFDQSLGESDFLLWRLTRGCDKDCGVQSAIRNLQNPCMRFLLLDELDDGLMHLQKELGSSFHSAIRIHLRSSVHRSVINRGTYSARVKAQLHDPDLMAQLHERLADDMRIYNAAVQIYRNQWQRPLASCNMFN